MNNILRIALAILVLWGLHNETRAERKGFQLCTLGVPSDEIARNIDVLGSQGATIVRFPMYIHSAPLDYWLETVENVLPSCENYGMVVVLTLHPGPEPTAPRVEADPQFAGWWIQIAQRLGSHPRLWYDLANEPDTPGWRDIALNAARSIRVYDALNHIVFAPKGSLIAPAPSIVPLPGISRQIIEFHAYDWYVHLQNPDATGAYPFGRYTKASLDSLLNEVKAVRDRFNIPVYIGEVAIREDHPNAPRFLRDFTDLCEAKNIPLTVHAFREATVWNYELNPRAWAVLSQWLNRP